MTTCFKCGKILPGTMRPGEYVMCKECEKKWTKFEETINRYVVEKMRDDVMKFKPFGWVFIPKMKDALTVSVDNKPIVLCQDCKHYRMDGDSHNVWYRCELNHEDMNDYFFCADGEKEEENAAER